MTATLDYNPLSPQVNANPYPHFRLLQQEDPVHWCEPIGGWVLTRYADVIGALRDPRLSSDRIRSFLDHLPPEQRAEIDDLGQSLLMWMVFVDPPDHTRLRALGSKAFTPRAVERMRPRVQAIVDELLDAAAAQDGMDVILDFGYPLPATVIAELLGAPAADRDKFKGWSDAVALFVGGIRTQPVQKQRARAGMLALMDYFRELIARRRREPKDDLISALLAAEDRGDVLSTDELVATCVFLLFAGHETTTNLIGNGLLALARHPEQLQRLREQPQLMSSAIEELLRYDGPVQSVARAALEDLEIGGRSIQRGERVFPMLIAADRDPAQFSDPDRLDLSRRDNRHIAFGYGIHYCLGAPLARLEGQIALTALLQRFPDLRVQTDGLQWAQSFILRGLTALPARFS